MLPGYGVLRPGDLKLASWIFYCDRASLIREIYSQTFAPAFASIRFAQVGPLLAAMSLFPCGSGHSEPPLGRQAGAASHLQAAVPTLLQALSSSESTVPRPVGEASLTPPACVALAGWLAEAGRRLGQPAACCGTDSGLRSASWPRPEPPCFPHR